MLDRRAVAEILGNPAFTATTPLFATVLGMVDPGDAALAERTFTHGLIKNRPRNPWLQPWGGKGDSG